MLTICDTHVLLFWADQRAVSYTHLDVYKRQGLGFAIGFVAMSARRALARGIAGINRLDHHAFPLRFVFDKRLKLKERPSAVFSSVGFPYRRPFADLLEILKRNAAPGVFGFLDELFGNNVAVSYTHLDVYKRQTYRW